MLACASSLAGCGLARMAETREKVAAARQALAVDLAACERSYPDHYRKPVMPRMRCLRDAAMRFQASMDQLGLGRDTDLTRAMTSHLVAVAEQYDAGRLSQAQFDAEMAATLADYNSRRLARQNSAHMVTAARAQASAAERQASAAEDLVAAARMPSTTVTCMRVGNMVTCH